MPPPKPQNLAPAATPQQLEHTNGVHGPASPLRSADDYDDEEEEEDDVEAEGYGETGEHMELEVGSMVEVNNPPLFGVIRWIGHISGVQELVAGIELVRIPLTFAPTVLKLLKPETHRYDPKTIKANIEATRFCQSRRKKDELFCSSVFIGFTDV